MAKTIEAPCSTGAIDAIELQKNPPQAWRTRPSRWACSGTPLVLGVLPAAMPGPGGREPPTKPAPDGHVAQLNDGQAAKKAAVEAQISRTGRDGAYLHYQWGKLPKPTG